MLWWYRAVIDKKVLLVLLCVSCIWGIHPTVSKILLSYATPETLIVIRFGLSSLTIFAYLFFTKQFRLPSWKHFFSFLLLGLLSVNIANTCNLEGLKYSSVTNCSLITSTAPLLISVAAYIFLKEKLYRLQWLGICIVALSTMFLITGGDLTQLFAAQYNKGDIIFLVGQIAWAAYTLISSRLAKNARLLDMIAWSSLLGVCISFGYSFWADTLVMPILTLNSIAALTFSIWINSMLSFVLWSYAVKHAGNQISSIFINLATLISIFLGIFILNEPVTSAVILGSIGILSGVFMLTQYKMILLWHQKLFYLNREKR